MSLRVIALALCAVLPGSVSRADEPLHPVVVATVLHSGYEKNCGLAMQLPAFHPTNGTLRVGTNAAVRIDADFELRFSWRTANQPQTSNDAPASVAADADAARRALLAAMEGSYSPQSMARVVVKSPPNASSNRWEIVFPPPRSGVSLARQFRLARRLVAAQLAARGMMAPLDGTWPPDFKPANLLALYDAEGVGYSGSVLLDRAVNETTLDARTVAVCGEDIREGVLDRCRGVLFPGGTGNGIARALTPDGVRRVKDFVARGGGYYGVCAGAYFAASGLPQYAGMVPLKHDQPWAKGRCMLKVGLTPEGEALLGAEFAHIETRYNCGPVFRDLSPDGKAAPVTVLARFDSPATNKQGVVRGEMTGTPAILSMKWKKGRILIVSPHPESHPPFYPLVARAIGWTIGLDPRGVHHRQVSAGNLFSKELKRNDPPRQESP